MHELLALWKNLFTKPRLAFSHITGQEKVGIKLILVLAVSMAAVIPLFPVISSDVYFQAQARATVRMMQDMGLEITPELQNELRNQEPATRAFLYTGLFLSQPVDIGIRTAVSALVVMVIGFFFRERRPYRSYISIFTILALFWILESAARNTIVLASNIMPSLATAQTLEEVSRLLVARTSLAVFLPANFGVLTSYTIDYCTDIFRLVQLGFLAIGISVVWQRDLRTAISAAIIFALAGYLSGALSIMQILGK